MPTLPGYVVARVGTAVVVGALAVLALATPAAAHVDSATAAGATRTDDAATELAERYAPVLRLRTQAEQCGSGTPYRPVDVDALMGNPGVALRGPWHTNDLARVAPTADDLRAGLWEYHLDFPGNALDPGCGYEEWQREIVRDREPVIYARVATDPARNGQVALQYWSAVGYSQHTGGERAVWGTDKLEIVDGTHPVVYPAEGSHANFFGSALYLGRSAETGVGCDDTTGPHDEIRPTVVIVPSDPDAYLTEFPWLGFHGRWGERHEAFFNGPTGPNMKAQWTAPIQWGEDAWRDDAVTVPVAAAVGPNVTNTFCTVVGTGSNLLRRAVNNPAPVLVGIAIVAGLLLVAAGRTHWVPDAPYPVAQRRAAGQLLGASARMYLRNWRLFVGIGMVYLPVMALAGAAQWLLVRISSLEALADSDGDHHAWVVLAVLLLGEAISLLAYVTVVAAVSAVLDEFARGFVPSSREAFRKVGATVQPLLVVTGRIVVVVGLLLLFIVTAPLAFSYVVRSALAVPAVMIETAPAGAALRRSRQLVRGRSWRVAVVLTIVVGLGLAAGPLLGIVLLLVSGGTSFVLINVIAGLVYALTIPFVALVIAYLYFDLRARESVEDAALTPN